MHLYYRHYLRIITQFFAHETCSKYIMSAPSFVFLPQRCVPQLSGGIPRLEDDRRPAISVNADVYSNNPNYREP